VRLLVRNDVNAMLVYAAHITSETDALSRRTRHTPVHGWSCIYRRMANFPALLYHYRMWLMRRLTQPRVSCYYSPWRTGPPPPLLSSFSRPLSLSLPFTTERAKRPFVSTHVAREDPSGPDSDAGFIYPMDPGSVGRSRSIVSRIHTLVRNV